MSGAGVGVQARELPLNILGTACFETMPLEAALLASCLGAVDCTVGVW